MQSLQQGKLVINT